MKKIQITADHGTSHSAWTKAPADVAKIADELGFERVAAGRYWLGDQTFIKRVLRKLRLQRLFERLCWRLEIASLRRVFGDEGGVLLLQHPLPYVWAFDNRNVDDISALKAIGIKIVVLVHDIGALRGSSPDVGGSSEHVFEDRLLAIADKIVVHNDCMRKYVAWLGVKGDIVSLDIFDYLVSPQTAFFNPLSVRGDNSVLLAGAFGAGKARYVQELKNICGVDWTLYGINYNPSTMDGDNVHYHGAFEADTPPVENGCRFGLVWDGESTETCAGPTGEYLRTNNPHKLSLYLSMGMPVIVWREAAVASFVEKNGVGITINSLHDIADRLAKMSDSEYKLLSENARHIAEELRSGQHTKRVLEQL